MSTLAKTAKKTKPGQKITGPTTLVVVPKRLRNLHEDPEIIEYTPEQIAEIEAKAAAKKAAEEAKKAKKKAAEEAKKLDRKKKGAGTAVAVLEPPADVEVILPLTEAERRDAERLNKIVHRGIEAQGQALVALEEIKERKLWRAFADSWEEYCEEQAGYTDRRFRQLLEEYRASRALPPKFANRLRSDHVRALLDAPEAKRVEILEEAEARDGGKIKAPTIREIIAERGFGKPKAQALPKPPAPPNPQSRKEAPALAPPPAQEAPAPPTSWDALAGAEGEAPEADQEEAPEEAALAALVDAVGVGRLADFAEDFLVQAFLNDPDGVRASIVRWLENN